MAGHQLSHSGDYSPSHLSHVQPELRSISSRSSLPSVPSLTSETQSHHCITTFRGHTSYITSLALAGNFLFSGSSDNEIRLWEQNLNPEPDRENISNNVVAVGKGSVKSMVVLGDKLFSAHQDHKIRVWKLNDLEAYHQKCTRLATLPTLSDRAIKLLTPNNHVQIRRHKKCTWVHHVDTVSVLALSKDNSLLYSVSWDRSLKIWRTSDFKCLESIGNAHDDAINALAVSPDGYIYTGSADKKIKVWRKAPEDKKLSQVATLEKHNSGINALGLSTDGSVLYSGASDRSIVVWEKDDSHNMVLVGALRGHSKSILCLAVVSDVIFSGSADNTIRIWRGINKTYSCLAILEGHTGPVKCLTAATDSYDSSSPLISYLVYSGGLDCDIKVWQIFIPRL